MTIQQKQCLLKFLGYYEGAVDGIWGPQSQKAEQAFRLAKGTEDLQQAVASWKEDIWADIRYFRPDEFACKCGCGIGLTMDEKLLRMADRVRQQLEAPCIVSSGLRCEAHNAAVGGVSNSRHLMGKAMDFCAAGKTAGQILAVVKGQPELRYAYAIDETYVHMDVQ